MPPSRKRKIAGNDAGSGTKFCFQFLGKPAHDIWEKITEDHICISNIHIPEIGEPYLNSFHPDSAKARERISQRVYLKPPSPDAVAPFRLLENPPIPASDINKKIARLHRHMIQGCPYPDTSGGVEHGALRNREYGYKGKGKEEFADNEYPHCNKKYYNPGWHNFSR